MERIHYMEAMATTPSTVIVDQILFMEKGEMICFTPQRKKVQIKNLPTKFMAAKEMTP